MTAPTMSYSPYINPQAVNMFNVTTLLNQKDSRWLQLEVCRESQRQKCTRSDAECKFAHPPANVEVQNGRVTACYDSIKVRTCNETRGLVRYMFHNILHFLLCYSTGCKGLIQKSDSKLWGSDCYNAIGFYDFYFVSHDSVSPQNEKILCKLYCLLTLISTSFETP